VSRPLFYRTSSHAELPSRTYKNWRRERDSNPRYPFGYSGFQDHRHRPLGHLSLSNKNASNDDFTTTYDDLGILPGVVSSCLFVTSRCDSQSRWTASSFVAALSRSQARHDVIPVEAHDGRSDARASGESRLRSHSDEEPSACVGFTALAKRLSILRGADGAAPGMAGIPDRRLFVECNSLNLMTNHFRERENMQRWYLENVKPRGTS
jgi:hypothetical protein